MALDGEYGGQASSSGAIGKEDMALRTVALGVFEVRMFRREYAGILIAV